MVNLTAQEFNELQSLIGRLRSRRVSPVQIREFIRLLVKGGASSTEIMDILSNIGFSSMSELNNYLRSREGEEALKLLVSVGAGLLIAYILSKK